MRRLFSVLIMAAFTLIAGFGPDISPAVASVFTEVYAGGDHSLALKSNGTLWAWGSNFFGAVGNGTTDDQRFPVRIGMERDWSVVSAGVDHSLALKSNGTLWAWGSNYYGQLGDGTKMDRRTPVNISVYTDWTSIAGGLGHTIGLRGNGTLWAWGNNGWGQLGIGTVGEQLTPVQIGTDMDWVAIAAGDHHSLALKADGTLWAWGNNGWGQLGVTGIQDTPVQVNPDTDWIAIDAGAYHSVALKADGTLWAWGRNENGQLGNGTVETTVDSFSPVQVGESSEWAAVSAGGFQTLAITKSGTLWGWGNNASGQLGIGTTDNLEVQPQQIGTDSNWAAVSAGASHTIALNTAADIWAWGSNLRGQLGDGTRIVRTFPVPTVDNTPPMLIYASQGNYTEGIPVDREIILEFDEMVKVGLYYSNLLQKVPFNNEKTSTALGFNGGIDLTAKSQGVEGNYIDIYLYTYANTAWANSVANPGLTFQANNPGVNGNELVLELVNPGEANRLLDIAVDGKTIIVSLATDHNGAITTTMQQLADALNSHPEAGALITASEGTGTIVTPESIYLSGGTNGQSGAQVYGSGTYDSPRIIVVNLATDDYGEITSTLNDIVYLINSSDAGQFVNATLQPGFDGGLLAQPSQVTLSNSAIPYSLEINGNIVLIQPWDNLEYNTTYKVTVPNGTFTDLAGNRPPNLGGFQFYFTTGTAQAQDSVEFGSATYVGAENGGSAIITVTRTQGSYETVSVDYTTSDGTAEANSDYTPTSGTLVFGPGETSKTFTVPIVKDTKPEDRETVNLTLSNPTGGVSLGSREAAILTIGDKYFAYISQNSVTGAVYVMDMSTNTVTDIISVGSNPFGTVVHPEGKRLYVTNSGSNTVSVLDTLTNTVTATVPVGLQPIGIAISPDGSEIYAANSGSNTLSVIETEQNTVTATVYVGTSPTGLAVSPDGKWVYVTNLLSNSLSIVNTANKTLAGTVAVGSAPYGIIFSPDGKRAYVTNTGGNTVSVVDTTTNTVTNTVDVGAGPRGIALTPDGSMAYVANFEGNSVAVINTSTNTVEATVDELSYPSGVAVSPDGMRVLVSNNGSDTVTVIDTASNTITANVKVGLCPLSFGNFIGLGTNTAPENEELDTTLPEVSFTEPEAGATGIALNSPIFIIFNENIREGSDYDSISIRDAQNNPIALNSSLSGDTLILTPLDDLAGGTVYTVTIPVNAVEDMNDHNLASQHAFSFTTQTLPDSLPPLAAGSEVRITTNLSDQYTSAIYGDKIVWEDLRNENPDIYLYDLATGTERQITTDSGKQTYPMLYGDKIVWEDARNGNWDIYMYDLNKGEEIQLTGNSFNQNHEAIYGNKIVWEDDRNGNLDIYLFDLATGTEFRITDDPADQRWPWIYGDKIVWEDHRHENWDIYMYDLSEGKETRITFDTGSQNYPIIHGNKIVWQDQRNGNWDVYMYDLDEEEETRITTDPNDQNLPAVFADKIVWDDNRSGEEAIYIYDLATGNELRATDAPGGQWYPLLFGDRIVYSDDRNGNKDIYLKDFNAPAIINTDPAQNAVDIPMDKALAITFSETIQAEENIGAISLKKGDLEIGYTYSINGKVLTIHPGTNLEANTAYTLSIPGGVVQDLAGNGLPSEAILNFNTVNPVPVTQSLVPDLNLAAAIRKALNKPNGDLTATDLAGLTSLETGAAAIKDLTGLEYAANLKGLYLGNNQISNLSVLSGLTGLQELWLNNNRLSDLGALATLSNLQVLGLQGNNITNTGPLANLSKLQRLYLSDNLISDLTPLAGLTGLKGLYLWGNRISDLTPLANLTDLQELWLNHNQISSISKLDSLTNLQVLGLQANQITSIASLDQLFRLQNLYLNNNQISDLKPLSNLTNLQGLDLSQNQITDVAPLALNYQRGGLGQGSYLLLPNNKLNLSLGSQASNQLQDLRTRGVNVMN